MNEPLIPELVTMCKHCCVKYNMYSDHKCEAERESMPTAGISPKALYKNIGNFVKRWKRMPGEDSPQAFDVISDFLVCAGLETVPTVGGGIDEAELRAKLFNIIHANWWTMEDDATAGEDEIMDAIRPYLRTPSPLPIRGEVEEESGGQFLQRLGMDGMKWAEEMHKRFPSVAVDEVLGWCCNMIMAGYDEAERRARTNPGIPADALTKAGEAGELADRCRELELALLAIDELIIGDTLRDAQEIVRQSLGVQPLKEGEA